ncbi:MAG: cation diffusion facilitator family transporter [Gammaproteobacteria bacterium]|nr:cation diffusion facilitator family transporter [Gammaproteobacteria bacterium]
MNEQSSKIRTLLKTGVWAAIALSSLLLFLKLLAWVLTGSVSILSSLVDSLFDVVASFLNWLAIRYAIVPADKEHRFGHGKAEALAGLSQAAFVIGAALFVSLESINRLFEPQRLEQEFVGTGVMVVATLLTLVLVAFQKHVIRETHSVAIAGDSLHYRGDIFLNLSVILSLIAYTFTGWLWVDPLMGGGIAIYLLYGASRVASQSLNILMDKELSELERDKIFKIAGGHPSVLGVHDLRTRQGGPICFIQLHLEMSGCLSLSEAHQVTVEVEDKIREAFANAEVIIHEDPKGVLERKDEFDA